MSFFALCLVVAVALLVRGYTCGQLARQELTDTVEASQAERAGERNALRDAFAGLDCLSVGPLPDHSADVATPPPDSSRAVAHPA